MRRFSWLALLMLAAAALSSCSSRGVYEGIQQQDALRNPAPSGQPAPRRQTYDDYESERRKAGATPEVR